MTVWFTVQLENRPGALGRLASALGDRAVNVTGIVGVAEDEDAALMLTTSDPAATRRTLAELGVPFEEHEPGAGLVPDPKQFQGPGRGQSDRAAPNPADG